MELVAIVFILKVLRHYLYGEQFEVFSDHKSLKYIFTQWNLNMRQCRWMEYLEDFEFTLHYDPGKENEVADALSQSHGDCWLVWLPRSGRCLRLWDSSNYTTRVRLRVPWGV